MFSDCLDGILSYINDSDHLRVTVGVRLDCALWNEARNTADQWARFPLRLHCFGWTQTDGAGAWKPIYHFAIIGKMKRQQEVGQTEKDFHDVCELIGKGLHQQTIGGYAIVATKGFMFDSTMTVTSENRRINVTVADDEVGFANFFWASDLPIALLASDATDDTVDPYDISFAPAAGNGLGTAGATPSLTDEQKTALATKGRTIGAKIF